MKKIILILALVFVVFMLFFSMGCTIKTSDNRGEESMPPGDTGIGNVFTESNETQPPAIPT